MLDNETTQGWRGRNGRGDDSSGDEGTGTGTGTGMGTGTGTGMGMGTGTGTGTGTGQGQGERSEDDKRGGEMTTRAHPLNPPPLLHPSREGYFSFIFFCYNPFCK